MRISDWSSDVCSSDLEGRRLQHLVAHLRHDGPVGLGLRPLLQPFRIGGEGVPLLLAVGERIPGEQVIERLVRFADQDGPEAGLADAVPLPYAERDRLETLQQCRQAAGDTLVGAQFVDHRRGSTLFVSVGRDRERTTVRPPDRVQSSGMPGCILRESPTSMNCVERAGIATSAMLSGVQPPFWWTMRIGRGRLYSDSSAAPVPCCCLSAHGPACSIFSWSDLPRSAPTSGARACNAGLCSTQPAIRWHLTQRTSRARPFITTVNSSTNTKSRSRRRSCIAVTIC